MATPLNLAFKRGYSSIYYLMIEGIPYTFTEQTPLRVDDDAIATAAAGRTTTKGLIIDNSSRISMETDRASGIGRGAAVNFTLAYKDLEEAGLLDAIFARATLQTEMTADATATATTISADTTGFDASGAIYFGREYITYTGVSGTAFTGCTRGVVGYTYKHELSSVSQSRWIQARPLIWRGRFVTLYESIVDRSGRVLDSQFGTGDYTREIWRGYIDKPPKPGPIGMGIECLPMCRLLANDIGYSVKWEDDRLHFPFSSTNPAGTPFPGFYDDGTGTVELEITFTGSSAGSAISPYKASVAQTQQNYFIDPTLYLQLLGEDIRSAVQADLPEFRFEGIDYLFDPMSAVGGRLFFTDSGGAVTITQILFSVSPAQGPYFLQPCSLQLWDESWRGTYVNVPFKEKLDAKNDFPYLIVQKLAGEGAQDFDVIVPGIGVLSEGDNSEIVRWDSVVDADTFTSKIAIRLSARGVGVSPRVDIIKEGWTLEAAVGDVLTVQKNMLTILESSGTTSSRGTYDTLPLGFGLGIPETLMDLDTIAELKFANFGADMVQTSKAAASEIIGGWIAASSNCFIDRRNNSSGLIKLTMVNTKLAKFSALQNEVETITAADVLLGALEQAEVVEPPNPVIVDTGCMLNEGAKITVRDSMAVQEQGSHPMTLKCPGMSSDTAIQVGRDFIYLGSGQYAITIGVGPWVNVQAGDPVVLAISHPGIYDWENGTTGPSSVSGRVVGWSRDLVTNEQSLTVLLDGPGAQAGLLCPVGVVASESGGTVTMTSGVEWFTDGDSVILYNLGEPTEIETLVIDAVSGDDISFTTSPSAFVGANTRITFPNVSAATAVQDDFFFKNTDYKWSG